MASIHIGPLASVLDRSLETPLARRVVIYRGASKFASATFASVYIDRDRPCCFHTDAAACVGGPELERRARE